MKTKINNRPNLSEQVINDLLKRNEIIEDDLAMSARDLQTRYSMAEYIGSEHLQLDSTDVIVVLSGRSGFKGTYLEAANKHVLCPDKFDSTDTLRRMIYGIEIAKKCAIYNQNNGIKKPVYIYFNGVKRQNDELKNILQRDGSFHGYPANLFIIDSIPLDNTMGQVIGLSKYLHDHWLLFCNHWGISRQPNIVFCTSSYHVPRVELGVCAKSPLLTPDFWHSRPDLLDALPVEFKDYVLSPGSTLKESNIIVLGCDRQITANPFWGKDLYCDMQASVNYSSLHRKNTFNVQPVPSIASDTAANIVTLFQMHLKPNISRYGRLRLFDNQNMKEPVQENTAESNDKNLQGVLICQSPMGR